MLPPVFRTDNAASIFQSLLNLRLAPLEDPSFYSLDEPFDDSVRWLGGPTSIEENKSPCTELLYV